MQTLSLPPSVKVSATSIDVTVLTDDGATVIVNVQRSRGLHDLPTPEAAGRATQLARLALLNAAQALTD